MEFVVNKIGFIGYGNMASGIAAGIHNRFPGIVINAYDINPAVFSDTKSKEKSFSPENLSGPKELCLQSDIVFLAVKPLNAKEVLEPLKEVLQNKILISILAGVSTSKLLDYLSAKDSEIKILRLMPNLNAFIGQSATTAFFKGDFSNEEKQKLQSLLEAAGLFIEVPKEDLLHPATGLAGSGPAFVFAFIQAMAEGGVLSGLSYNQALELSIQTVLGSASLLKESGEHPSVWRNKVTSAGGTTITGLAKLEKSAFHSAVMNAVKSASDKSFELGKD